MVLMLGIATGDVYKSLAGAASLLSRPAVLPFRRFAEK